MRRTAERALLVAALLAAGDAARAAPAACDLDVRLDPARGRRGPARLTVAAPAAPALAVSAGTIGPPREVSPGLWEAEVRPPPVPYPLVAIASAVAGDRCGFAVLPLRGRAEAHARGAPGAEIVVRVGEQVFGPVRADRRGRAVVPVDVPPGTTVAWHEDRALPLPPVPPVPHVALAVPGAARRADRDEAVPVRVLVVGADGAPRRAAPLALAPSHGAVDAPVEVAPGLYAATWRLPAGPAGDATLQAGVADEPERALARVARVPGPAAIVDVAAAPDRAVAGAGPVALAWSVRDAAGNAVEAEPEVRTDAGALEGVERTAPGRWRARLRLPEARSGRAAATVEVRAGDARGRLELPLVAAEATAVRLEAPPSPVVADGRSSAPVRVAIVDRFGNPLAGAPQLDADGGGVSEGERQRDGSWTFQYRPARRIEPGEATLRAAGAGARAEARIGLAPPRPWIWLAPRAGWAASRAGFGFAAGFSAEAWARIGGEALGLALDVGRLGLARTSTETLSGAPVRLASTLDVTTTVLALAWYRPVTRRAAVWASAGGGLSHLAATATLEGQPAVSGAGLAPRAELAVAGGARVPGGLVFLEARAGLDGRRRLAAFDGALSTLTLSAGYRWDAR